MTGPGEKFKAVEVSKIGTYKVQMYITDQFFEIRIFLTDNRFVTVLKKDVLTVYVLKCQEYTCLLKNVP
jgi:hypothetical protein